MIIGPPKDNHSVVLRARDGVVASARNLVNVEVRQALDALRPHDDGLFAAGALGNPRLAEVVEPESIDMSSLGDGEAVVGPSCYRDDPAADAAPGWRESRRLPPLDDASAQLALLTTAPGEDLALLVQSQDMVVTCSEGGDLAQSGDQHGRLLDHDLAICGVGRESDASR